MMPQAKVAVLNYHMNEPGVRYHEQSSLDAANYAPTNSQLRAHATQLKQRVAKAALNGTEHPMTMTDRKVLRDDANRHADDRTNRSSDDEEGQWSADIHYTGDWMSTVQRTLGKMPDG